MPQMDRNSPKAIQSLSSPRMLPSPVAIVLLCLFQLAIAGIVVAAGCFTHYYDHRSGLPMFQTGPFFFVAIGTVLTIWGVLRTRIWTLPLAVALVLIWASILVFMFPWSELGDVNHPYWFLGVLEAVFVLFFFAAVIGAQLFGIFAIISQLKQRPSSTRRWRWPLELAEIAFMGGLSPFVYYLDYQLPIAARQRWSDQQGEKNTKVEREKRRRDEETSHAIQRFVTAVEHGDDAELREAAKEMGQVRNKFFGTDFELGDKLANPTVRKAIIGVIHQHQIEGGYDIMEQAASNENEDPENRRLAFKFLLRGTWGPLHEPYIGPSSPEMIPFVLQMVRNDRGASSELRVLGIEALSRVSINSGSQQEMPRVLTELQSFSTSDPDPAVRAAAAKAIPKILENRPEIHEGK